MFEKETEQLYALVVFPIPVDYPFTYKIPTSFLEDVVPGVRVLCPFGHRKMTGFVVSRSPKTEVKQLKEIEQVLDPVPLFTSQVLEQARWIADYYMCGWGEVLKAALPAGITINSERVVRLTHHNPDDLAEFLYDRAPRQADIVKRLAVQNPLAVSALQKQMGKNIYSALKSLREKRYIRIELELPKAKVQAKFETIVKLSPQFSDDEIGQIIHEMHPKAPKQAHILETLLSLSGATLSRADLCRHTGTNSQMVKALEDKGYVILEKREVLRDYYESISINAPKKIILNEDQAKAVDQIKLALNSNIFHPFLLYGVTGSGKTQVYIESIYHILDMGKTAIILVPEISLTPQMVRRFRAHFGDKVAVFHSRMSPGERYDSWRKTWEGFHKIVIGPRSAIFAPLKNVGLVVVDEEHEPSYKQTDQAPKYHARDIAVVRAFIEKAVVVLGSATPSIESYYNTQIKKYNLIKLPNRIDAIPMPKVAIVDMKKEPKSNSGDNPVIFSRLLRQKIDEKLHKGEQIILFLNRRGFATMFKCKDCGYLAKCKNCDITLTFHIRGKLLKCHYCGYTSRAPDACPQCRSLDVFLRGVGTQRVEEELNQVFPGIKSIRMDMDTMKGRMAHDKVLSKFASGEYQILLGTQMVAKGLDFPNVTLVGVISADTELLFPDFRAAERTFQLLTQVAGRAGRKEKLGEVVIQTFSPEHYSLQYAKKHDYDNFFKAELYDRKGLLYPPFSRIINILFKGTEEKRVEKVANQLASFIVQDDGYRILGPVPAQLSKIQNNYRWQLLLISVKSIDATGNKMKEAVKTALKSFKDKFRVSKVTISIDIDPISIL